MKNKCKIMMLVFFLAFFAGAVNHNKIVGNAETQSEDYAYANSEYQKEHIKMKIVSVSKKKFKIRIENTGDKNYRYCSHKGMFTLKKYEKGKWKKLKFEKEVKHPKSILVLSPNSSMTVTIKWKDYYNNNLKKGKYKFIWPSIATTKFKVK